MPTVYIFAVLLDDDKDIELSEKGSINEIYLHLEKHDLLTADGCCHRQDAVRYLTASGLQSVYLGNNVWTRESNCFRAHERVILMLR